MHEETNEAAATAKCQACKERPAREAHPCPFKEELHHDFETECNCCAECEYQCSMDI